MTTLFLDIDDSILAQCLGNSYDLRPGVMTQLSVLAELFNCCWLTHWNVDSVHEMLRSINAPSKLISLITYYQWRDIDPTNKAPAVLLRGKDFYWLEDKHSTGSLEPLEKAGLIDRYVEVESHGLWGFTRASQVLFSKAGITDTDIEKAGGKPYYFMEPLGDHYDWHYY